MAGTGDSTNFDMDSLMGSLSSTPRDLGSLDGYGAPSGFEGIKLPNSLGAASPGTGGGFLDTLKKTPWFSSTDSTSGLTSRGKLNTGMDIFSGLAGAYLGWQQFNLAKDQLAQNKKIFNLNFGAQAQTINTQLEDRQRARVSATRGMDVESVSSYLDKNAIKQKGI